MKILIVTPARPGSRKGNRVTAIRWSRLLRQLGHRVVIREEYGDEACDLLVALHARRSFASVERFRALAPGQPLIVALTGTDLYEDIHKDPKARQALAWAWRLVVLQPLALRVLPRGYRAKSRVIYQSSEARAARRPEQPGVFRVCVLGHLRPVKDPFRTARAARLLPASSSIQVVHLGAALSQQMLELAHAEAGANPRYRWLGDVPRRRALGILARSNMLVLTSRMEGGANVLSEAIAAGVPVLASSIAGSVGILGARYPGYFPVGNTRALARLLQRAESDADFYERLRNWCRRLQPLFRPARERESWRRLLSELTTT
jgi:putative glycosyltransferase (TIGR04348 family)